MASWPQVLRALTRGVDLDADEATWAMNSILEGSATEAQIGGFAMALRAKGESAAEVESFVTVMLDHAKRVGGGEVVADHPGESGLGEPPVVELAEDVCVVEFQQNEHRGQSRESPAPSPARR